MKVTISESNLKNIIRKSVNEVLDRLAQDGNSFEAGLLSSKARERGYDELADRLEKMANEKSKNEYGDTGIGDAVGSVPAMMAAPFTAGRKLPRFSDKQISEAVSKAIKKLNK